MDVEFPNKEDLKAMIDVIAPLKREGIVNTSPSIGNWLRVASTLTTRDEWTDKPGALGDDVIDAIRQRFGLGWWGVSLRICGREDVVKLSYKVLEDAIGGIKPQSVRPKTWVKGEPLEADGWAGVPITFPMQNSNWYGGRGGHVGFSPIIPQDGTKALEQFQRTYARYQEYGMDYQGSFAFGERHMINVNAMLFNQDSPEHLAKVDTFFRQLVADAKEQGYGEYRTHLDYMDLVAQSYDFNGNALLKLNEKVKNALDPNGILAPGKSGIWPRRLASQRANEGGQA
jgi:4-cresol dehydrogenase (hydroxylating)